MISVRIEKRVTNKYRDAWRHLDTWKELGYIVLTNQRVVEEGNNYDEGNTYVQFCRIPAGANVRELIQGIRETMGSRSRCRHEYDCCGCASYSVTVKRYGRRQLMVRTRVSYNY